MLEKVSTALSIARRAILYNPLKNHNLRLNSAPFGRHLYFPRDEVDEILYELVQFAVLAIRIAVLDEPNTGFFCPSVSPVVSPVSDPVVAPKIDLLLSQSREMPTGRDIVGRDAKEDDGSRCDK